MLVFELKLYGERAVHLVPNPLLQLQGAVVPSAVPALPQHLHPCPLHPRGLEHTGWGGVEGVSFTRLVGATLYQLAFL